MTDMYTVSEEHHPNFLHRLRNSDKATIAVAKWMSQYGTVRVPKIIEAPSHAEAENYKDNGDLFFLQNGQPTERRFEIKGRSIQFTSKNDVPYEDLLVCSSSSFIKAANSDNPPEAYITVAKDLVHIAMIYVRTKQLWKKKQAYDAQRGYHYMAWYCTTQAIDFHKMRILK